MSYGPHSNLVEEVAEFVGTGMLLSGGGKIPGQVHVVGDFSEGKRLAWEDTFGADELTWANIREQQLRPVSRATYGLDWYRQAADDLVALMETFTGQVKRRLPARHSDVLDDVVGDLYNVAKARALLGGQQQFFELLFAIYRAGGWPCGWRGDYPNGEPVAFMPSASAY